jgi:hypothetical protein
MLDNQLTRKLEALELICNAPLWPRREELPAEGHALFDAIVDDAKQYALAIVDGEFLSAFMMAARWSPLVNQFMDAVRIVGNVPAERLLSVYVYYCRCGADFAQVSRA